MRWVALMCVILFAGCAAPVDAGPDHWTFTERSDDTDPVPLREEVAFDQSAELVASGAGRQIGGRWHGPIAANTPFTLRFNASVPMRVEFRLRDDSGASASGTCNWEANSTSEKEVGVGRARMRSTDRTCEIVFTPSIDIHDPTSTLRWEARSREPEPEGWRLQFDASLGMTLV